MAEDDKWIYVLIGALVGIPVGMIFYKYVIDKQDATAQTAYGASYSYDEQGHITSYTPIPLTSKG